MIGRRFVESPQYRDARTRGVIPTGEFELRGVPVATPVELRRALSLRTYSDLAPFDIDGTPQVGELPAFAHLPGAVETIPLEQIQALLAAESSDAVLATAVNDGQPYPEAGVNFGATPTLQKLPRFGTAIPVTLGQLDEPGVVASIIDRRISRGIVLGLENDILNGNAFTGWTSALAGAGATVARTTNYRADALCLGVAAVQTVGWYENPLQIVVHPTTRSSIYTERDSQNRPLGVTEELDDMIDAWIISKEMPIGTALVGDFFSAVGLLTHGGLEVSVSKAHADFFTRNMVELTVGFRAFSWLRQPTALCTVTNL